MTEDVRLGIVIHNAILLDFDPIGARPGELRVAGDAISHVGERVPTSPGDERVDGCGCVVMPGLVNGHTHLYSALAVGMPPPPSPPRSFHEILERVWWRLDRALDEASIQMSAAVGALDALHCGTTTLIDHHASPNWIAGSLDALERGIDAAHLRAVLCYETTDRNGEAGAAAGLAENRRYLDRCASRGGHRFGAMVGAHAAFTMGDQTLRSCAGLAAEFRAGVHIHVAEDPCDDRICREKYGAALVQRLDGCGILRSGTILAHCTHLSSDDARRLSSGVAAVAHNPRSNMNNQVGYAPIGAMANVQLGTDGIGSDMFTEARQAWFKARDAKAAVSQADIAAMLAQSARTAGRGLGCTLGKLEAGAAADVVVTDYHPATPIDRANAAGHLIFGLGPQHVRSVMINGRWAMVDRTVRTVDEGDVRRRAARVGRELWQRIQSL
jgi:putative selenium metabolism protein SsnA